MKIFVPGGAGYIGSILVEALLTEGHRVTVLDNFMYGQFPLAHLCYSGDLEIIKGDFRDTRVTTPLIKSHDIIIPLAAIVGAPACDTNVEAWNINVLAQTRMYELVQTSQVVIYPTTNSGYGIGEPGKFCTEETPLKPISEYGRAKVKVEEMWLQRENSISLRLATVFGMSPRMRLDLLVNDIVYRALWDKTVVLFEPHAKRNYIHVRDVAAAMIHCLLHFPTMRNNIYNVGLSDANLSKMDLCLSIKRFLPDFTALVSEFRKDPDQRDYIVSNEKLESKGWRPSFTLQDGIRELINGYQQMGRRPFSNV